MSERDKPMSCFFDGITRPITVYAGEDSRSADVMDIIRFLTLDRSVFSYYFRIEVGGQRFLYAIVSYEWYAKYHDVSVVQRLTDHPTDTACLWTGKLVGPGETCDDVATATTIGEIMAHIYSLSWYRFDAIFISPFISDTELVCWWTRHQYPARRVSGYVFRDHLNNDVLIDAKDMNNLQFCDAYNRLRRHLKDGVLGSVIVPRTLKCRNQREPANFDEAYDALMRATGTLAADVFALVVFMCDELITLL